eukprot:201557_1
MHVNYLYKHSVCHPARSNILMINMPLWINIVILALLFNVNPSIGHYNYDPSNIIDFFSPTPPPTPPTPPPARQPTYISGRWAWAAKERLNVNQGHDGYELTFHVSSTAIALGWVVIGLILANIMMYISCCVVKRCKKPRKALYEAVAVESDFATDAA